MGVTGETRKGEERNGGEQRKNVYHNENNKKRVNTKEKSPSSLHAPLPHILLPTNKKLSMF